MISTASVRGSPQDRGDQPGSCLRHDAAQLPTELPGHAAPQLGSQHDGLELDDQREIVDVKSSPSPRLIRLATRSARDRETRC